MGRVSEIVIAGPHGRLADLGVPEVLTAGEMVQSWLNLRGMHHRVLPVHVPGKVAQGFRRGYNTCPDQPVRGHITWTEWVQRKYEVKHNRQDKSSYPARGTLPFKNS